MTMTFSLLIDQNDIDAFSAYLDKMGRKASREEILPILKRHMQVLVARERAILSPHSKSGALVQSLTARAGSGDREGTISVFSSPTATPSQLRATWGKKGRKQQQGWYAGLAGKGRRRVFYGNIVHQGHRVVKRNAKGQLYDTGKRAEAIPFAAQASAELGEQQAQACAEAIMKHITEV
jgi:hypothetical protein